MDDSTGDEWEYIYDTNQTQTITLTIDLSTNPLGSSTTVPNPSNEEQHPAGSAPVDSPKSEPSVSIQFLELLSEKPYISYKGQIFTGTWGETLGSDLIFASTSDLPNDVEPVMQSHDGKWCLLGISQTTLVAKPVEVTRRSRVQAQAMAANGDGVTAANPDGNDVGMNAGSRKPFTIVLPPDADPKQRKQAEYLEQLMAIKMAKGEKDVVYLGRSTKYIDAEGREHRGPLFSKRDWDMMGGTATQAPGRSRKIRRRGAEDESLPGNRIAGNEVDLTNQDTDGEENRDEDVDENQEEDEEAELENERHKESPTQVDSSDENPERNAVEE